MPSFKGLMQNKQVAHYLRLFTGFEVDQAEFLKVSDPFQNM